MDRMGLILLVENLDQYEAAVKAVKSANDQVAAGMGEVEVKSKKSGKGVDSMAAAFAKGSIVVMGIQKALSLVTSTFDALVGTIKAVAVESTQLAARYHVLDSALDATAGRAGYTKGEIDKLQEAIVKKGVTYQAATELALQLLDAEVGLEGALDLVTTAQNAASRAGASTSDTISRLIWAMQTGQPELLRAVYLNADFTKAEEDLAKSLNTTREALTPAQQMQARMNGVVEAGIPLLGTYDAAMKEGAKAAGSLQDRVKNIKTVLGEITYPAWSEFIISAKDGAEELFAYLQAHKDEIEDVGVRLAEGMGLAIKQVRLLIDDLSRVPDTIKQINVVLTSFFIGTEEAEKRVSGWGTAMAQFASIAAGAIAVAVDEVKRMVADVGETISALPKLLHGEIGLEEFYKTLERPTPEETFSRWKQIFVETTAEVGKATGAVQTLKEETEEGLGAPGVKPPPIIEPIEEQIKAAEALIDLQLDLQREYADELIKQQRETLKQEIDLAHEREDMARENAKAVAEAYADAEKDRIKLIVDGSKKMDELNADAAKEGTEMEAAAAEEREDLDRDYADRKVDIERDTVRRLRQIQQEFEMSVQDAARTRDAFALVQAQRRAAQETQTALEGREQQLGDARVDKQRQAEDNKRDLAKQRAEYTADLEERRLELAQSLHEDQIAIESQLQEKLVSIEQSRQEELANKDLQLQRERELQVLQSQWEQEDRTLKLQRQLEDMQTQYGSLGNVTAQGLQQQVQEWANAYGPEGAATQITVNFKTMMEAQLQAIMDAAKKTTASVSEQATAQMKELEKVSVAQQRLYEMGSRRLELEYEYKAPPELQLQSPKLGIQLGLEKLQEMMSRRSMPAFVANPAPAAPPAGGWNMPSRVTHEHGGEIGVNVNAPGNLDLVVQRSLVTVLRGALKGATAS